VPVRTRSAPLRWTATALLLLAAAGCGGPVTLDGAIATIPVFAPASLKERHTSFTSDDVNDIMKFSTYTWDLETGESPMAVDAYYMAQWPGASRTEDEETINIRNPPIPENEDAPLPEGVLVTIKLVREGGKTQFSISEDVFRAKRR
jgi:hypothetical protein